MSKRLKNELTQLFQMVCNGLNIVKEPIQQDSFLHRGQGCISDLYAGSCHLYWN